MRRLAGLAGLGALVLAGLVGPAQASYAGPPQSSPAPRAVAEAGLDPSKAASQYMIDTWTTDEGLPQNSVNAVLQTRDGYIWLGTQEGVARFDGRDFQIFDKQHGALLNNVVTALCEGLDGSLWVGTRGGGLTRYHAGRFTTFTTRDGLVSDRITALLEEPNGTLWIGTPDGLARYRAGAFETVATGPDISITALTQDASGILWVGTRSGGVLRLSGRERQRLTTAEGLAGNDVAALWAHSDGSLWVASFSQGLTRYTPHGVTQFTTEAGLPSNSLRSLYEDRDGSLWIGLDVGGVARWRPERLEVLSADHGLSHDVVRALFQDREGSLWLGTDGGGLARLRDGKFTTFTTHEGLADNFVYTVYEDARGVLWAGSWGGGVSRYKNGQFATLTTDDGLASNLVISIYGTRDGSLWIGTYDGGLSRLKNGRITTYTKEDGLPGNAVFALYEDRAGTLWIGTASGLGRYRHGRFSTLTTQQGLSSDIVSAITEDAAGRLLVGTFDKGINVLAGGRVEKHYTTDNGLLSNAVLSYYVDGETVWIGTQEGGLHCLRDGELTGFSAREGLFSETILQILEDNQERLWMTSNRGLFHIEKAALDDVAAGRRATLSPTVYGKADGLRSPEFNGGVQPAGWRSENGRLWFPSVEGLVSINPEHIPTNDVPPPVHVQALLVDGTPVPLEEGLRLPPGKHRLEIRYAGLSYVAPSQVQYRYKLEGIDEGWIEAGTRREAFYTNLRPGAYTFRVMASNNDGVWNEQGVALAFYQTPFFYQTAWFRLLVALIALGVGVAAYRIRVRTLTARHRELEQIVEARTHDLRQTNNVLRDTSEMKSQLMRIIAHDLKNPLGTVRELAKLVRSEVEPGEEATELLDMIESTSNRMLSMVTQLLEAEALDSGAMSLSKDRVDLREVVTGAVRFFQPQAERKAQTFVIEAGAGPCAVYGDGERLVQVIDNLISNAIKYSPRGKTIRVRLEQADDSVRFFVEDEGPGLTADDKEKLFGKFQRLSARPTGGESSSGLGLSIVRRIVEVHSGRVWAESEKGRGSTFIVELPAYRGETATLAAAA